MRIEAFKRRAGLGYRKRLEVISIIMLFKTVIPLKSTGFETILYALLLDP